MSTLSNFLNTIVQKQEKSGLNINSALNTSVQRMRSILDDNESILKTFKRTNLQNKALSQLINQQDNKRVIEQKIHENTYVDNKQNNVSTIQNDNKQNIQNDNKQNNINNVQDNTQNNNEDNSQVNNINNNSNIINQNISTNQIHDPEKIALTLSNFLLPLLVKINDQGDLDNFIINNNLDNRKYDLNNKDDLYKISKQLLDQQKLNLDDNQQKIVDSVVQNNKELKELSNTDLPLVQNVIGNIVNNDSNGIGQNISELLKDNINNVGEVIAKENSGLMKGLGGLVKSGEDIDIHLNINEDDIKKGQSLLINKDIDETLTKDTSTGVLENIVDKINSGNNIQNNNQQNNSSAAAMMQQENQQNQQIQNTINNNLNENSDIDNLEQGSGVFIEGSGSYTDINILQRFVLILNNLNALLSDYLIVTFMIVYLLLLILIVIITVTGVFVIETGSILTTGISSFIFGGIVLFGLRQFLGSPGEDTSVVE